MKSTSRDIWGIPPGGFAERRRRRWIRPTIAGTLVLALGIGGGALYSSMKQSTAVSTQDALAEFRSSSSSSGDTADDAAATSKTKTNSDRAGSGRSKQTGNRARTTGAGAAATTSNGNTATSRESSTTNATAGTASVENKKQTPTGPVIAPPEEGVYSWTIDGYERGPGVERRLPRKSHRVITHEGGNNWVEHHIFSEQKELWFHLGISRDGVAVRAVRNRVVMGPVEVDRTVNYSPAAFVSRAPFDLGQTWSGKWDGKTSGSYEGKTIDHGTVTIGGEKVEVWVTEVHMEMSGEVTGTAVTRSWVAPEYRMVVRQYQETEVTSGPGEYYSEWEGQLTSLTPQR